MQKIWEIIFAVGKNLLAFLAGALIGILNVLIFAKSLLGRVANSKDIGLGIIALAPAVLVLYSFIFGAGGGIIGIIIYNLVRFVKRRKNKHP